MLKEHTLRQHAGWPKTSQMHLKYIHYFGNESNESILNIQVQDSFLISFRILLIITF